MTAQPDLFADQPSEADRLRFYLERVRKVAVIPNGKEDDIDYLRSAVSLAGIYAGCGLDLVAKA